LAGARALASAYTAVDRDDPEHTAVRAAWAGWLTPDYAHRVLTAKIVGPLGVEWDTWYRHRAYVMVTAQPSGEDHPPDTAAVAARKVVLRERAVGRDGWRGAPTTAVVVVVLKKVNKVWRIDSDEPS
jgi:capsid protein